MSRNLRSQVQILEQEILGGIILKRQGRFLNHAISKFKILCLVFKVQLKRIAVGLVLNLVVSTDRYSIKPSFDQSMTSAVDDTVPNLSWIAVIFVEADSAFPGNFILK